MVGCVWFIHRQRDEAMLLVSAWLRAKQQNKSVEWKAFVDTVRSRFEKYFFVRVLLLSMLSWCRKGRRLPYVSLEWLGRLKCLAIDLDAFLSSFSSYIKKAFSKSVRPSRLPISPIYIWSYTLAKQANSHYQPSWSNRIRLKSRRLCKVKSTVKNTNQKSLWIDHIRIYTP